MARVDISDSGDFKNTENFFKKAEKAQYPSILDTHGRDGVARLSAATPVESGKTASAWSYRVRKISKGYQVDFYNANVNNGVNIAVILQYGHGTGTGGYVQGIDYINPALRPVFDSLVENITRELR